MIKQRLQNVVGTNNVDGGFSVFIRGQGRYVVGVTNNVDVSWDMLVSQYKRLYNSHETFTFGGWKSGNIYYLDFGVCTDHLELALYLGKSHWQKSIRDNLQKKTIDIVY